MVCFDLVLGRFPTPTHPHPLSGFQKEEVQGAGSNGRLLTERTGCPQPGSLGLAAPQRLTPIAVLPQELWESQSLVFRKFPRRF